MYMLPLFYALTLYIARSNTSYSSKLLLKRYLTIRNPLVANIFISKSNPHNPRVKNRKENYNKITVVGLVSYALCFLLLVLYAIMFFVDSMGPAYYEINTRFLFFIAQDINEQLIIIASMFVFSVIGALDFINSQFAVSFKPTARHRKFQIVLYIVLSVLFVCFAVYELLELFSTIVLACSH